MPKVLEVCVDSLESARAAIEGGAGRLELCSSLSEGGLTPTPGLLNQILNETGSNKIPIYCMLRCRPSHFVYTQSEIEIMVKDAKILRQHGADGFVFGALLPNGDVDMKKCHEIVKACFPLPVTFHRAFDFCRRPTIEIEVVIDLGFTRVLTSGKQKTALLGSKLIAKLMEQVGSRIIIVPAGGVTKANIRHVVENTGASEYHGSFRTVRQNEAAQEEGQEAAQESEVMVGDHDGPLQIADKETIAEIVHFLRNE